MHPACTKVHCSREGFEFSSQFFILSMKCSLGFDNPRRTGVCVRRLNGEVFALFNLSFVGSEAQEVRVILPAFQLTFLHPPVRATVGEVRYSIEIDVGGE